MYIMKPGLLVDKDDGLWTLRREFESPPGYHFFYIIELNHCVIYAFTAI